MHLHELVFRDELFLVVIQCRDNFVRVDKESIQLLLLRLVPVKLFSRLLTVAVLKRLQTFDIIAQVVYSSLLINDLRL